MDNIKELYPITDTLNQVAEFHRMFNHPIHSWPRIPDTQLMDLRYKLLKEELDEFREACLAGDIVAVADALADLQYVLSGAVLSFGLQHKFKALFEEVQRSNMSKACEDVAEAECTIAACTKPAHYEERNGKYLVYRTEDRKTIKSINYSPADLKSILGR